MAQYKRNKARFYEHVCPPGFVRMRYDQMLASGNKAVRHRFLRAAHRNYN